MFTPIRAAAIALVCSCMVLRAAATGGVHYVDATGNGHFTDVQAAIDAVADGDLILVRSGEYPGFTIDGRSLSVVADAGADVRVTGTVSVRNTPPSAFVLVADLDIEGTSIYLTSRPGLELLDNGGHVRVQGCGLEGGDGYLNTYQGGHGGAGASVKYSLKTALVRCTITGGDGYGGQIGIGYGGNGGPGLVGQGSALALYDCVMKGGAGGDADFYPGQKAGHGGDGCRVIDGDILASGCSFLGGYGGGHAPTPGNGGHGLVVLAGQAQLLDCSYAGGSGGWNYGGTTQGNNGQPQSGAGAFNFHAGSARSLVTTTLAAESASVMIQITGDPGDQVWLLSSSAPGFQITLSLAGILLILPQPMLFTVRPLSVLPQSGTATIALPTSALAGGAASSQCFAQGLVLGTDGWRLSSPVLFVVLDCSSLGPDCNANGSNDSCDILATSNDCDKNGVPDDCDLQSGASQDCNQNDVPDECDIAGGTSKDLNGNGIPDECETGVTWYVDAAAPPGGNGSQSKPFKAIGDAIPLSVSGDTVLVANGTYKGPSNREISFGGRDILVKSQGGAPQCIIDCENLGRAFLLYEGETLAARIEGFTITRGYGAIGGGILLSSSSATIKGCNIDACFAQNVGGGIFANSRVQILECIVSRCNTGTSASSEGGGMYLSMSSYGTPNGATSVVRATLVTNCTATNGAGIAVEASRNVVISHCTITLNQAGNRGGGLYSATYSPHPLNTGLRLDNTRLLNNRAKEGGGAFLHGSKTRAHVTNVTIANNGATIGGGGLHIWSNGGPAQGIVNLVNTILWNNSAPVGPEVQISGVSMVFNPSYSDIQGGQAQVAVGPNSTLNWGAGNIDLDPLFANAHLKLGPASPCIDAGDATAVTADWGDIDGDGNTTELVPFDLALQPRVVDIPGVPDTGNGPPPIVDMGAYERQG